LDHRTLQRNLSVRRVTMEGQRFSRWTGTQFRIGVAPEGDGRAAKIREASHRLKSYGLLGNALRTRLSDKNVRFNARTGVITSFDPAQVVEIADLMGYDSVGFIAYQDRNLVGAAKEAFKQGMTFACLLHKTRTPIMQPTLATRRWQLFFHLREKVAQGLSWEQGEHLDACHFQILFAQTDTKAREWLLEHFIKECPHDKDPEKSRLLQAYHVLRVTGQEDAAGDLYHAIKQYRGKDAVEGVKVPQTVQTKLLKEAKASAVSGQLFHPVRCDGLAKQLVNECDAVEVMGLCKALSRKKASKPLYTALKRAVALAAQSEDVIETDVLEEGDFFSSEQRITR